MYTSTRRPGLIARLAATVTAALGLVAIVPAAPALAAGTVHGCPSGYACIYPQNAGWNGDRPSLKYYRYGSYQLSNQFGNHYVLNNQTGGAPFWACTDWNGNTCPWYVEAGRSYQVDLTPINSVRLTSSL